MRRKSNAGGVNRSRVMKTAHAEWKAVRHKPGMTFARCLKLAWAVERKRIAPREYYQPPVSGSYRPEAYL